MIVAAIIGLILLFFILKEQSPIFFPNQQKERQVKIADHNIEAQIHIYLDKQYKENFEVSLYNDQTEKDITPSNIGEGKFTPKGKFYYVYDVEKGETYTAKIKNKTDSIIISNVIIESND